MQNTEGHRSWVTVQKPMPDQPKVALTVTALVATYNEEDIIEQSVGALLAQGIRVYVLEDGSTDGTVRRLEALQNPALTVEPLTPPGASRTFSLSRIIERKQALARTLASDWFINADADEFRESVWPNESLVDGIARVERLGFSAIDFEVLNFWPTSAEVEVGDIQAALTHFERASEYDLAQIRCWKKSPDVELLETGGHDAVFPGRRVFPVKFLLRHYPLRGQTHAQRKIFEERVPRFDEGERARGWHVQYAKWKTGQSFVREASELERFDPEKVRWELFARPRGLDKERNSEERRLRQVTERALDERNRQLENERKRAETLSRELDAANREKARLGEELHLRNQELEQARADLAERRSDIDRLCDDLREQQRRVEDHARALKDVQAELRAVYDSKTWRWTGAVRQAARWLKR
jgi:glycosyltransferase involved in cell wall biosynthesis